MKTRAIVPIVAAADALLAALVGVGVPLLVALAVWFSQGAAGDAGVVLRAGVAVWALSLGGRVAVTLDPAFLGGGATEPVAFTIGIAPLALTAVTLVAAYLSGRRLREGSGGWIAAVVGVVVFGVAAAIAASAASQPAAAVDVVRTTALGALWYGIAMLVGARAWNWDELGGVREALGRDRLELVGGVVRGVGVMLLALWTCAVGALAIALVFGLGRILTLFQQLSLDVAGAIAMGLAQIAVLPNAIVWAAAWLLGPGFEIGAGSTIAPTGTTAAPLPLFPLLGALPEQVPIVLVAVVALPVLAGVLGGVAMRRHPAAWAYAEGWQRAAAPAFAALVAAIVVSLAALAAGGPVGPGRLAIVGPPAAWVLLLAFVTFAVGGVIGAFVPGTVAATEAAGARTRGVADEPEEADEELDALPWRSDAEEPAARTTRRARPGSRARAAADDDSSARSSKRRAARVPYERADESDEADEHDDGSAGAADAADDRTAARATTKRSSDRPSRSGRASTSGPAPRQGSARGATAPSRRRADDRRDDVDDADELDDDGPVGAVTGGGRASGARGSRGVPGARGLSAGAGRGGRSRSGDAPRFDDEPDIYAGIDPLSDD